MKLFNTLTRRKEEFIALNEGKVGIYSCGPTVYDFFHIGNARAFVMADTLRRYLEFKGYQVNFVQNFTDIDDKMINRAKQEGTTVKELADRFISEFYIDAEGLGLKKPTVQPKATEHIQEMIEMIQKLIGKGLAYEANEDVYFDTSSFNGYGKLSHQNVEDLEAGARVEVNEKKKNPLDFVIWKAKKEGEPSWSSPWGEGRPGWHIECSAMSIKYLGETVDIHTGGVDLVFPHHENEIAQSEGTTGKPFVRYWFHNGFINVDNEKMSKSLGNFFTARDISKEFDYEVIRFYILSIHYRNPINYSKDSLEQAKTGLERLYNCINNLNFLKENAQEKELTVIEEGLIMSLKKYKNEFIEAMEDDLNTADSLGSLFEAVREVNSKINENSSKKVIESSIEIIMELAEVLGILGKVQNQTLESEVEDIINKRQEARKNKDWTAADDIRDQLKKMGIIIEDTPQGVRWKKEH